MMLITLATPADAHAVAELTHLAYSQWIPVIGRKPAPMTQDYAALVAQERVYVARNDEQIIGAIVVWPIEPEPALGAALYIDNIAVHPDFRQRGIGEALLTFAEAQARAQGLTLVRLLTNEKMVSNQAFYRKRGYNETRREPIADGRLVWMHKHL